MGAVNTIRFEGRTAPGGWRPLCEWRNDSPAEVRSVGFNTDADGLVASLREDLSVTLAGAKVVLLGAGGAGRTAALKLASEKVSELFLVNRTHAKILEIRAEIQKNFPAVYVGLDYPKDTKTRIDLVVNATSLGLKPGDPSPLDAQRFACAQAAAVYDLIYRPAETALLQAARAAGCRTANGLGMLLHQGAKAFEIWTGQAAPVNVMRQALVENIHGKS